MTNSNPITNMISMLNGVTTTEEMSLMMLTGIKIMVSEVPDDDPKKEVLGVAMIALMMTYFVSTVKPTTTTDAEIIAARMQILLKPLEAEHERTAADAR